MTMVPPPEDDRELLGDDASEEPLLSENVKVPPKSQSVRRGLSLRMERARSTRSSAALVYLSWMKRVFSELEEVGSGLGASGGVWFS